MTGKRTGAPAHPGFKTTNLGQMKASQPPPLGDASRQTRALRRAQSRPSFRASSAASEACQQMPVRALRQMMLLLLVECRTKKYRILSFKLLSVKAFDKTRHRQLVPNSGNGRRNGGTENVLMAKEEASAPALIFRKIGSVLPCKLPPRGGVQLRGMPSHQMFGLRCLGPKRPRQLYLQPLLGHLRRPLRRTCSSHRRLLRHIDCSTLRRPRRPTCSRCRHLRSQRSVRLSLNRQRSSRPCQCRSQASCKSHTQMLHVPRLHRGHEQPQRMPSMLGQLSSKSLLLRGTLTRLYWRHLRHCRGTLWWMC